VQDLGVGEEQVEVERLRELVDVLEDLRAAARAAGSGESARRTRERKGCERTSSNSRRYRTITSRLASRMASAKKRWKCVPR